MPAPSRNRARSAGAASYGATVPLIRSPLPQIAAEAPRRTPAPPPTATRSQIAPGDRPVVGEPQVVHLTVQPVEPGFLVRTAAWRARPARPAPGNRPGGDPVSPPLRRSPPAAPGHTRARSPAARSGAPPASALEGAHQVLIDQPLHDVERLHAQLVRRRHGLHRLQGEAPGKDAQPAEDRLLLRAQAGHSSSRGWRAACDGGAAGRGCPSAAGQAVLHPRQQRRRRQQPGARRRQLHRQGQSIQAATQLRHGRDVARSAQSPRSPPGRARRTTATAGHRLQIGHGPR